MRESATGTAGVLTGGTLLGAAMTEITVPLSQAAPDWPLLAPRFEWDGSLRDVVVYDCELSDWLLLFKHLQRRGSAQLTYPSSEREFWSDPATIFERFHLQSLWVHQSGIELKCDLVSPELMEFDLDPRLIRGQPQLDALLSLMSDMASALNRPVLLTEDGAHSDVILKIEPGQ